MSLHPIYDVCVIGAGVVGSSAARYLASRGQKTLLLEQFPLPHWRGSSHGQTRIIRFSYAEAYYTKMVGEARQMWEEIEAKAQQEIMITNIGLLTVEQEPGEGIKSIISSLDAAGESYEVLSSQKLKKRFPELSFPSHYTGLLEHSAGILKADKCLKLLQQQFVEFGGTLKDGEGAIEVHPGSLVTIKTAKNLFTASKVIITAGPWTNKLLKPLGMTLPLKVHHGAPSDMAEILSSGLGFPVDYLHSKMPTKATVLYWKTKQPGTYSLQSGFPTFHDCTVSDGRLLYAIPSFEYPDMVKFGPTGACKLPEIRREIDPDARDMQRDLVEVQIQRTSAYVREHFPHLDYHEPAIVEACTYTLTPDENYVLDKHPKFPNVVIGAGFSGHGFKLGPVSGKILAQLALNETPSYDMSPFRIARFKLGQHKASL